MNYPPDTCVVLLSCSIYDMSINLNDSKADDTAFCGSEQTLSPPPERQGKRISWKVGFYLTCVLDRHHDVLTCQIQAIYIYPVAIVSFAAVFWAVTQRSHQKERLLTSEQHSFPVIIQSQLGFHFQEPSHAKFAFWDSSNQGPFFIFVSSGPSRAKLTQNQDDGAWRSLEALKFPSLLLTKTYIRNIFVQNEDLFVSLLGSGKGS